MNYSIVAIGGLLVFILLAWFTYGRYHFRGPIRTIAVEESTSKTGGLTADVNEKVE
jgi:hypothetical protein